MSVATDKRNEMLAEASEEWIWDHLDDQGKEGIRNRWCKHFREQLCGAIAIDAIEASEQEKKSEQCCTIDPLAEWLDFRNREVRRLVDADAIGFISGIDAEDIENPDSGDDYEWRQ